MATSIPTKGVSLGRFSLHRCLNFIQENGDSERDIIIKSDQENSAKFLIKEIQETRLEGRTIPEESPVGSSGSNGVVERGVQEIEGEIRALFLGLQERLGRKLDGRERIVAFIPEYGAYLLNRLHQGMDGKVSYERSKGKRPRVVGLEFGEKVMYGIQRKNVKAQLETRWAYGIFVGMKPRSNEFLVATKTGIHHVRSVKRIPLEERWGEDCVSWVVRAPWHRYKGAEDADGDVPEGVPVEERRQQEVGGEKVVYIETKTKVPRDFIYYTEGRGSESGRLWFYKRMSRLSQLVCGGVEGSTLGSV